MARRTGARQSAGHTPGPQPGGQPIGPRASRGIALRAAAAIGALLLARWLASRAPADPTPATVELARPLLAAFWIATALRAGRAWASRRGSGQTTRERGLRTIGGALLYALSSAAAAGAIGRFDPVSLTALHALVFLATPPGERPPVDGRPTPGDVGRGLRRAPVCAITTVVLVAIGIANAAWGILSPIYHPDDIVYHLPFPIEWVQRGNLETHLVPFGNHSPAYHPKSIELLYAWLLLPLRRIEVASLCQALFAGASVYASYDVLRRLQIRPSAALVCACLVLASATLTRFFDSAYVDFAFMFGFLASVGAILRLSASGPETARADALELAAALGLFAGTKSFGVLFTAIVLAPAAALLLRSRFRAHPASWSTRIGILLAAVAIWLAAGGWWTLSNLITTGNPIFPMRVEVAGVVLFDGAYDRSAFGSAPLRRLSPLLPWPLAFVVALGAALALARKLRVGSGPGTEPALARAVVTLGLPLAMAVVFVLLLPTGYPRFVLAIVPLAAGALAIALDPGGPLGKGLAALLAVALGITLVIKTPNVLMPVRGGSLVHTTLVEGTFAALGLCLALALVALCVRVPRRSLWWAAIAALGLPSLAAATRTSDPMGPHVPRRVARAWHPYTALEREVGATTIAVTGTNQKLRAYGRSLANRVGYANVNATGDARFHEHFRLRRGALTPTPGDEGGVAYYRAQPDIDAWIANLDDMGAEYLVVTLLPAWAREQPYERDSRGFPLEHRWALERPDRFELTADYQLLKIFRIVQQP